MAGTSLLALLDDIASLLDDVAALSKTAVQRTAGVLGDDLALNAEQVSGVEPDRELPVVWAVAKGSAINKLIIVPVALILSVVLPVVITPLLMIGGAYLCFEGAEKVAGKFLHPSGAESSADPERKARLEHLADPGIDLVKAEKAKIKGAIRTDFILSMEIIVIALGTVAEQPLLMRSLTIVVVAAGVTVGVYLFVAGIVKMDDLGLHLCRTKSDIKKQVGGALLWMAPRLLKTLTILGTVAMFLVGGGILAHGTPPLAHLVHGAEHMAGALPTVGVILGALVPSLLNGVVGLIAGAILLVGFTLIQKVRGKAAH